MRKRFCGPGILIFPAAVILLPAVFTAAAAQDENEMSMRMMTIPCGIH